MGERSERGQILVLFVAIFSAILVLLAFAVDQGFWLGNRRVKQGHADAAARAGAFGYLYGGLSDVDSAVTNAQRSAQQNGATAGVTVDTSSNCDTGASTIVGAPSVRVRIQTNVPGLFSRVPMVSSTSGIDIGAEATACVGAAQRLVVANRYDSNPDPGDNTWKSIPIAIRGDSSGPCYESASVFDVGHECAILGPLSGPDEHRLLFEEPPSGTCKGGGSPDPGEIENGVSFTCWIEHSGGCGGQMQCLHVDEVDENETDDQAEAFDAMRDRLNSAPGCDDSFEGAFGDVAPPPKFGGTDPERAYMQSSCFDTRRLVVLPVIEDQGGGGGNRSVIGFAVVYVTGCYDKDDRYDDSTIDLEEAAERCEDAAEETNDSPPNLDYEIRGVPINTFSIDGSIGDIGTTEQNSILTIQTVK